LEANAPHTLPVATKPRLKPTEGGKPPALAPTEGGKPLAPAPTEGGKPLPPAPTEGGKPPASTKPRAHPKPGQNRPGTAKALAVVALTGLAAGAAHWSGGQVGQPVNRAANASSFDPISTASLYGETSNQSAPAALLHDIGGQTSSITQQLWYLESLTIKIQKGMSQFRLVYPRYTTGTDDTRRSAEAEAASLFAKINALVLSATSGGVTDRMMIPLRTAADAFLKYLDYSPSLAPTEEAPHVPPAEEAAPAADTAAVRKATGFDRLSFAGKFRLQNNARLALLAATLINIPPAQLEAAAAALDKDASLTSQVIVRAKNCITSGADQLNVIGANKTRATHLSDFQNDPAGGTGVRWVRPYPNERAFNASAYMGKPWVVVNATDLQRVTSIYATPGAHPSEPLKQALQFAIDIETNRKRSADPELVRLLERCARDVDAGKHASLTTVVAALALHTESASYMIDLVTIHTIATVHRLINALPESKDKDMLRDLFKVPVDAYKRNGEQVQSWGWFSRYHKLPSTYYFASVMLDVMNDLQPLLSLSDVVIRLFSVIAVDFSDITTRNNRDPTPYPIAQFQDDGSMARKAALLRVRVQSALKRDPRAVQLLLNAILVDTRVWAKGWWAVHDSAENTALNAAVRKLITP
jgi:hypothetical protein